ncbi:aspartate--tRNA(Asn) ligase [Clostridium sp. OS1-26]|uniref:aspartate--tRNA(Asn) ligase n=1 Tax=Clostridium sp. OS1-26 TaxID=3070681 RepID=UPI0027E14FC4|nr:aspartate--tRNA(Asn) ligase [Clostridium sp. OS1-26]WML34150.1 aspartate--tRNA(Asn) ligase [Clostridium sp. OS1-26]
MKRTLIRSLEENLNKNVIIKGWVHRVRRLKGITFIILRDRSGMVQCVVDNKEPIIHGLKCESVLEVSGTVKEGKNSLNNFELAVESLKVLSKVEEDLPIEINGEELNISLDTMLNNRILSLRHEKKNAIFRIQHIIVEGFREFLSREGFIEIFTPKIVAEGAEGGTALFKLNYFGRDAYLAQSPQFYKQMMVASGYERVFEIGNFFRAEEHDTARHLNQFTSMDLEVAFIEDEQDIMDIEEEMLKHILNKLELEGNRYFKLLNLDIPKILASIPRVEFEDAARVLKENYNKIVTDNDLDPEGERLLSEYAKEKYNSDFIFVTNYSRKKRPMYTMPKGINGTRSFDLIFKGTEITSGGQRIHDYDMLVESFKIKGLNHENFSSYVNVFKYGVPPHGGLAIGLERLLALLLGINNIRETSAFPRDRSRLTP